MKLILQKHRWFVVVCTLILLSSLSVEVQALGRQPFGGFDTGEPGVAVQDNKIWIALPLINMGPSDAEDVTVDRILLGGLRRVRPESLPLSLGQINAGEEQILQLGFQLCRCATSFPLVIEGMYRVAGHPLAFQVQRMITVPPYGEGQIESYEVGPVEPQLSGEFPPSDVGFHAEEANPMERPPIPEGVHIPTMTPVNPPVNIILPGAPEGASSQSEGLQPMMAVHNSPNEPVTFVRAGSDLPGGGVPWDPSGVSVDVQTYLGGPIDRMVFLTGNTYALLSTDGGASFTKLNPAAIFPNWYSNGSLIDGGLCCDQVVTYIPSINRVIWLMQFWNRRTFMVGNNTFRADNRLRLASASPEVIINSGGKGPWIWYDITTAILYLTNEWLDYPSMAFTDNFLYVSVDAPNSGSYIVMRLPFAPFVTPQGFNFDVALERGSVAYGAHLARNSPRAAYWAGHVTQSLVRFYEWRDNELDANWVQRYIQSWRTDYTTLAPNGVNCMGDVGGAIVGATVVDSRIVLDQEDVIRFAWTAGRSFSWETPYFPQPHIRVVDVLRVRSHLFPLLDSWSVLSEHQIWNPTVAFGWPDLATNPDHETGISLSFCGGGFHTTPAAGFDYDSTVYAFGVSQDTIIAGGRPRYGDYTTITRHWPNDMLFSVSDYVLERVETPRGMETRARHQYRLFGRTADVGSTT